MTDIGQRIAVLREERGLSQKQLSDELAKIGLKVRRETITQWENGTRDLKTEYTIKLADFFGVTCDYILREIEAGNISIYKETGLTNESINNLKEINMIQLEFGGVCFSNSINVLIGSKCFVKFLLAFFNCQSEIQKLVDCKKRFLDRLDVCEGKIPLN